MRSAVMIVGVIVHLIFDLLRVEGVQSYPRDLRRTNLVEAAGSSRGGKVSKRVGYGIGGIESAPAISSQGLVIVGSLDGKAYAYDMRQGDQIWNSSRLGKYIAGTPILSPDEHYIYLTAQSNVNAHEAILYALNTSDGNVTFSANLTLTNVRSKQSTFSSPALYKNSTVVIVAAGDTFYAVQVRSSLQNVDGLSNMTRTPGDILWTINYPGQKLLSSAAIKGEFAYFTNANMKEVVSIYADSGKVCWSQSLGAYTSSSPVLDPELPVLYVTSSKGVYCVGIGTSCIQEDRILWFYPAEMPITNTALSRDGRNLYFGTNANELVSVKARKSSIGINSSVIVNWSYGMNGGLQLSSPVVDDNEIIYATTDRGVVYAFSGSSASKKSVNFPSLEKAELIWSFETDLEVPIYASPVIGPNETLLVASSDGTLFALAEAQNPIQTIPQPQPTSDDSSKLSPGAIAGIAIAAVILVCMLCCCAFFVRSKMKNDRDFILSFRRKASDEKDPQLTQLGLVGPAPIAPENGIVESDSNKSDIQGHMTSLSSAHGTYGGEGKTFDEYSNASLPTNQYVGEKITTLTSPPKSKPQTGHSRSKTEYQTQIHLDNQYDESVVSQLSEWSTSFAPITQGDSIHFGGKGAEKETTRNEKAARWYG